MFIISTSFYIRKRYILLQTFITKDQLTILTILAISFFSCNSGNDGHASTKTKDTSVVASAPVYDNSLATGHVIDSVICKAQPLQSYALYLPANYSATNKYPVIYFFDPHARGALPLRTYKALAEKYGFILVGSNMSRNGTPWSVTNGWVKALMDDTRMRISIDGKRIYTAGFSGGSRVASSIAIMDGGVTGVICAGAGFPSVGRVQDKFDYFGIVGNRDFNFSEMVQLDEALQQNGFSHQLLTSGGIHDWPSLADMATGLLWLQLSAIKQHLQPPDDSLVKAFKIDMDGRIAAARASGDWINAHDLSEGTVRIFDGLSDVSGYKQNTADIAANKAFKDELELQKQLQNVEMEQQESFRKELAAHDVAWWAKKIADMQHHIKTDKALVSQMDQRLINYIGFLCYMNADHYLQSSEPAAADTYIKIFTLADPKNPDHSYLSAVYCIKKGDKIQAISTLNDAVSLGYSDIVRLTTDPVFNLIRDDAPFKDVVNKVRKNYSSK